MPWPNLDAAHAAALAVLTPEQLHALTAAGLSVVLTSELSALPAETHLLEDVTLDLPEDWTAPYPVSVTLGPWPHGVRLALHAHPDAVTAVREARELQRIMNHRINLIVNDAETLVYHAQAVES